MKKRISLFVATLLTVVAVPAASFAANVVTNVTGHVYENGIGVGGAKVTVVCNGNDKKTTTDASGAYVVTFNKDKCPDGSKATVVATKGSKGGANSGPVSPNGSDLLNIAMVNVDLPEFGLVAGIGATLIGGGAFLVIRRRQLSGHQA